MKSFFDRTNIQTDYLIIKYWKGDYKSLLNKFNEEKKYLSIPIHTLSIITKKNKPFNFCFIYNLIKISSNNCLQIEVYKNSKQLNEAITKNFHYSYIQNFNINDDLFTFVFNYSSRKQF